MAKKYDTNKGYKTIRMKEDAHKKIKIFCSVHGYDIGSFLEEVAMLYIKYNKRIKCDKMEQLKK